MTRDLDPDRRRPAPPHPGFHDLEDEVPRLTICKRCIAVVPDATWATTRHQERDQQLDALLAWMAGAPRQDVPGEPEGKAT